jgi:competence protein ComEC
VPIRPGAGLGALAGSCAALWTNWLPSSGLLLLAAALAAVGLARRWSLAWAFGLGLLWSGWHAQADLAARWPAMRDDARVLAEVYVDSLTRRVGEVLEFDANVSITAPRDSRRRLRARVRWRIADPARAPQAAERWQLLLRLRAPRSAANPGAIDMEREWFRGRTQALALALESPLNQRLETAAPGLLALRAAIVKYIERLIADRDAAALAAALGVGATGSMSREQWRVFAATGTTHLVAISGLHVTLFSMLAILIARRAWAHLARLPQAARIAREPFAVTAGLSAALGYALLAGLSIPTQRTLCMLFFWHWARLCCRNAPPAQVLALSCLAVLLLDPYAPLASGFWLSFGAMSVLLTLGGNSGAQRPESWRVRLRSFAAEQYRVGLGLAPLTLLLFHGWSPVSLPANLLAIPVFSLLLVPLVLLSLLTLGVAPQRSADALALFAELHELIWPLLQAAAELPAAWWSLHAPHWWVVILALAVLMWTSPLPVAMRASALVAVVPLVAGFEAPLRHGEARLTVLETGRSVAVLVETARHVLLYDTGERYGSGGSVAEQVVVRALRARNVHRIDRVVVTQASGFRMEGAAAILAEWPDAALFAGGLRGGRDPRRTACAAPQRWVWDGIRFEFLHPRRGDAVWVGGQASCVLRIANARQQALLTGQIDAAVERVLLEHARRALRAHTVVVPRAGARSASTPEFVAAIGAHWAVFTAPRPAQPDPVAARWRSAGAEVLYTGESGALTIRWDLGGAARLEPTRRGRDRLWREPP